MPTKKPKIMSLAVDLDIQDKMKAVAKKRNISVSKLIRDMVEKNLPNVDEEVDIVVFKVPFSQKTSSEGLRNWLLPRMEAVVKALTT
jgi:hypothetical protein